MNNKDRIKYLTNQHERLDLSTTELESKLALTPSDTKLSQNLAELKRKKLKVKDELAHLIKSDYADQESFDFHDYDR